MKRIGYSGFRNERAAKLGLKSLAIAVLFLMGLGGLVYPVYSNVQELEGGIAAMKSKLAEQDVYLPYYAKLQALQKNVPSLSLPLVKKAPLERNQAFGVVEEVERIAHGAGMDTLDIGVDQGALRAGLETTVLTGVFSGHKESFYDFYVAVESLPYVRKVKKVELRAVPGGVEVFLELAILIQR